MFWKWNTDYKTATWNVISVFRTGTSQILVKVLNIYNIKVVVIQRVRLKRVGQITSGEYTIFFFGMENALYFGRDFAIHRTLVPDSQTPRRVRRQAGAGP